MSGKIYTLTGDNGTTALVGGKRVDKDDVRVEAYGTVDELNSQIGLLARNPKLTYPGLPELILKIQNKLFNIGSYLATDNQTKKEIWGLTDDDVKELETKIDEMSETLPPMKAFILPGGSKLSCLADVCRTVTRRTERRVVTLSKTAPVDPLVIRYLNRLSDFFFVFARFNNVSNQVEEILWNKDC